MNFNYYGLVEKIKYKKVPFELIELFLASSDQMVSGTAHIIKKD